MITYSTSVTLKGSNKNSYRADEYIYCFGKGTTYDFTKKQVSSLRDLIPDLMFSAVSPYIYTGGHRDRSKVIGVGNVLIIDIDAKEDIRVDLFKQLATFPYQFVTIPTQNHWTLHKGVTLQYKYRLAIPIEGVTTVQEYKSAIRWMIQAYNIGFVDSASWTDARFFAPTFPLVGQRFANTQATFNPPQPYVVTEAEVQAIKDRVGIVNNTIPLAEYPQKVEGEVLKYSPDMNMHQVVAEADDVSTELSGRTLTIPFESADNSMSKAGFKRIDTGSPIAIGDIAQSLRGNQRVFCQCPTHDNHTDGGDIRYSWLLKTGSGEARLYCASDTCKALYGDYRRIVLPNWQEFIGSSNFSRTSARTEELVDKVTYNLLVTLADWICRYYKVEATEWHEKLAYAKEAMFKNLIDENALHVLCLLTTKEKVTYIYDISLSGGMVGALNIKGASKLMQGSGWFSYIFKGGWTAFVTEISSPDITKPKILDVIVGTVSVDIGFTELKKEGSELVPSLLYSSAIKVDIGLEGRRVVVTNNSFDEPVFRKHEELGKRGIPDLPSFTATISAFANHWRLPYGSVQLGSTVISDLPTLIILFSALNMYTDGKANQRHTAFVVTAPPGIGKTSLIKNIAECGLSNDDGHSANVFGYPSLYPQSIDDAKNKLWTTGDELSPALMREVSMPLLLSNLTRKNVRINVKGKIDSEFTSFCKVLWGAKAWDAISTGTQATELRSRLFAVTYTEEMFDIDGSGTTPFLAMCQEDIGELDSIVQYWISGRYIEVKSLVLSTPMDKRIKLLNDLKLAIKAKYAGTLTYVVDYDEETGAELPAVATEVASDKDRALKDILDCLLRYRSGILANPSPEGGSVVYNAMRPVKVDSLGTVNKGLLACEEAMFNADRAGVALLMIPRPSRNSVKWFETIVDKVYGEDSKRGFYLKTIFSYSILHKYFAKGQEVLEGAGSKDTRRLMYTEVDVRNKLFSTRYVSEIEDFILNT